MACTEEAALVAQLRSLDLTLRVRKKKTLENIFKIILHKELHAFKIFPSAGGQSLDRGK